MTDPVTCPHCREQLDIPSEYRGRAVRCASCQTVFATPPPSAADDPPEVKGRRDDERPHPPANRRRYDAESDRPRRAGNGVVWVLLAFTLLTVGGCVAGCLGFFGYMYNPKMHPFTSPEAKFRIEFPGDGEASTTGGGGADGVTVTAHRAQSQEKFVVKRFDLPAKLRGLPNDEALTEVATKELQGEGANQDNHREVTAHDGFPAVDMRAASGKGAFNRRVTTVRCVLVEKTVYVVLAQGPGMEEQPWWVRRYFTSFEVTDQPKKVGGAKGAEPKKGD